MEAIDIHLVQDRTYTYIRRLVAYLLKRGRLKSLMLYNTRLSDMHMRDLLAICSGYCRLQSCEIGDQENSHAMEPSTLKSLLAVDMNKACRSCTDDKIKMYNANQFNAEESNSPKTLTESSQTLESSASSKSDLASTDEDKSDELPSDSDDLFNAAVAAVTEDWHKKVQSIPIIQSKKRHGAGNVQDSKRMKYEDCVPTASTSYDAQPTVSIIGDHSSYLEKFSSLNDSDSDIYEEESLVTSSGQERGLQDFVIMFTGLSDLDRHLEEALCNWPDLRKIAISHSSEMLIYQ